MSLIQVGTDIGRMAQPQWSRVVSAWNLCASHPEGPTRFLNTIGTKIQWRLRMTYLMGMPRYMGIEPTNRCSGGCVLCPTGQRRRGRPLGDMPLARFKKLVDEVSPYVSLIWLYDWGEPLHHAHIYDMMTYTSARGIDTRVCSNLHPFDPRDAERLVRTGITGLGISIHGLSEETYQNYQPKHRFAEVMAKLETILDARRRLGRNGMDIYLDFIVRKDNEHEAVRLPEFAKELGVGYVMMPTSLNLRFLPYDRQMIRRSVSEEQLRRERLDLVSRWLPSDAYRPNCFYEYVRTHGGRTPPVDRKLFPCHDPWETMIVSWDGDVNLCCGSFEKKDRVGNVFKEPVRKIWNNAHYHAARRSICGSARRGDPRVLCRACPGMLL